MIFDKAYAKNHIVDRLNDTSIFIIVSTIFSAKFGVIHWQVPMIIV
jgi:hypothetical protein